MSSNKLEDAVRLLAKHAQTDIRQQVEAMLGPSDEEKAETKAEAAQERKDAREAKKA